MTNIQPNIIQHLGKDQKLRILIDSLPLYIDYSKKPVFDQLIKSVISQQLSTTAAATIYNRFYSLLDTDIPTGQSILNLSTEKMRSAGLSFQKANYIHNIATFFEENKLHDQIWESYTDDTIIEILTAIKGVGVWTVQMLLMFTLQREDVFPVDDLIIRKSIVQMYGINTEKKQLIKDIHAIGDQWRPYRSIACRYLWAGKDQLNAKL